MSYAYVAELHVTFLDDDPDLFLGLADERGHDRLAGFEVARRQVPGAILIAGVLPLAEQDPASPVHDTRWTSPTTIGGAGPEHWPQRRSESREFSRMRCRKEHRFLPQLPMLGTHEFSTAGMRELHIRNACIVMGSVCSKATAHGAG